MSRLFTLLVFSQILLLPIVVYSADENVAESEKRLGATVKYLASDELEGRGVDTQGINKAADYLAAEFTKLGLKTDLFDGSPFQKFEITVKSERGPKEKNHLVLTGPPADGKTDPTKVTFELDKTFSPLAVGGSAQVDAPLVFAGYGITDKDNKYDDYANIDVKDKVIILIRKEPQQGDPHSVFNGTQPSEHATFNRKIANASEHGAKAVILVNDDFDLTKKFTEDKKAWRSEIEKLAEARAKLHDKMTMEEETKVTAEINKLAESIATRGRRMREGYDALIAFAGAGEESGHRNMPVWFCLRSKIEPVIQQVYGKNLTEIEKEIDANLQPVSKELPGWKVAAEAAIIQQKAEVKNVIAVLEGEGPHADETIVIGAHYDHVGMGGPGSLAPWTNEVHNGADDNASGTSALLETAHRLVKSGKKPKHRIVFMAFTGEERGLLGSAYYCRHPRFALEKTIAMLNMDMVGRLTDDKLIVYGTGTATGFDALVNEFGEKHKFKITKHEGGFGPSDHASFYAKKIPVIHLFTGNHADYHRPSDDFDKINVPGMRRVVDFLLDFAEKVDASDARPEYREVKKIEHVAMEGDRPYFGSIPDYSKEDANGLALMGVVENGPAAKAGLMAGDLITQFGESKITGIEDFDSALRKFKPGDKVKIQVKRGDKVVDLEVLLGKRGG